MKNITLSMDEQLIEVARQRASSEHSTLNEQFRIWLEIMQNTNSKRVMQLQPLRIYRVNTQRMAINLAEKK